MQKLPNIEGLRTTLKAMERKDVLALAASAGLSGATLQKFRMGTITEPRMSKLLAIQKAVDKPARKKAAQA